MTRKSPEQPGDHESVVDSGHDRQIRTTRKTVSRRFFVSRGAAFVTAGILGLSGAAKALPTKESNVKPDNFSASSPENEKATLKKIVDQIEKQRYEIAGIYDDLMSLDPVYMKLLNREQFEQCDKDYFLKLSQNYALLSLSDIKTVLEKEELNPEDINFLRGEMAKILGSICKIIEGYYNLGMQANSLGKQAKAFDSYGDHLVWMESNLRQMIKAKKILRSLADLKQRLTVN
jgi:hypothetical protein